MSPNETLFLESTNKIVKDGILSIQIKYWCGIIIFQTLMYIIKPFEYIDYMYMHVPVPTLLYCMSEIVGSTVYVMIHTCIVKFLLKSTNF